jgi:hypothetical protein
MKSFAEYLTESKKTYEFKIKIAGDLSEAFSSELQSAMEKFAIVKMGKGKRTPIQEVPLDFPTLKNSHVTVFDIEVNYPTTPQVLESYICQVCGCPAGNVVVRTANAPSEEYQKNLDEKTEHLLDEPVKANEEGQSLVGEKRISSFLKDLANDAKDRACKDQPKGDYEAMPEATASISPVGSHQNKLPVGTTAAGLKGK